MGDPVDELRAVLVAAAAAAADIGAAEGFVGVGTHHLLLGILTEGGQDVARLLATAGVEAGGYQALCERLFGPDAVEHPHSTAVRMLLVAPDAPAPDPPAPESSTPAAAAALAAAARLRPGAVRPIDLLAAILAEETLRTGLLASLARVSLAELRDRVRSAR